MAGETQTNALNQLRNDFGQVVETYNSAIRAGKVRAIRPAAVSAHQAVFALAQAVKTSYPDQVDLLSEIEAAYIDIRWGRLVGQQSR